MAATAVHAQAIHPNPIFEGMEKRLEIDFRMGPNSLAQGLRAIPRETLDELMTLAACCIVSNRSNAAIDAYVLSESSLFITESKWVLKTCGTTRLLNAIPRLLEVTQALGMAPRRCKYSRASFLFPQLQPFPYTSFDNEVDFLEQRFGNLHPDAGAAYVMGDTFNGMQWHVYIADDMQPLPAEHRPTYNFEVCMTGLGVEQAAQFFRNENFVSAAQTTRDSGIAALKPNALIDDYVFEPCGYSMNGIDGTGLITIHITPEAHQSFASVEFSGFAGDLPDPRSTLSALTRIFAPARMTYTLTVDRVGGKECPSRMPLAAGNVPANYRVQGTAGQLLPGGGIVSFFNVHAADAETDSMDADADAEAPSSPREALLHHASSFLSLANSTASSQALNMLVGSASDSDPDADACACSSPSHE